MAGRRSINHLRMYAPFRWKMYKTIALALPMVGRSSLVRFRSYVLDVDLALQPAGDVSDCNAPLQIQAHTANTTYKHAPLLSSAARAV